jgi:hypothetical protein
MFVHSLHTILYSIHVRSDDRGGGADRASYHSDSQTTVRLERDETNYSRHIMYRYHQTRRGGIARVVIRCGHTPVANPRTAGGSTATTHHHKLYYMYNTRSIATPIGEDNTSIGDSARATRNREVLRCHHHMGIHTILYNLSE